MGSIFRRIRRPRTAPPGRCRAPPALLTPAAKARDSGGRARHDPAVTGPAGVNGAVSSATGPAPKEPETLTRPGAPPRTLSLTPFLCPFQEASDSAASPGQHLCQQGEATRMQKAFQEASDSAASPGQHLSPHSASLLPHHQQSPSYPSELMGSIFRRIRPLCFLIISRARPIRVSLWAASFAAFGVRGQRRPGAAGRRRLS